MKNKIAVEGIKLYAYHGCLPEEEKIGTFYITDVYIETDFSEAAQTDNLNKTVDYVDVYTIVKEEMAIRSKLIEQVGQRIFTRIKHELQGISGLEVKISKLNPPMNGNVDRVWISIQG